MSQRVALIGKPLRRRHSQVMHDAAFAAAAIDARYELREIDPDALPAFVAETRGRTVVRLWLTGPRAGQRGHLVTDLPGYPDNISRGTDGLIWVTVASPVDALVERLGSAPMTLRRAVTKIPDALQPKPRQTIRVQAFADDGALVHDLDIETPSTGPGYHMVTGVREHHGRVWMGSLHEPAVAVHDLA